MVPGVCTTRSSGGCPAHQSRLSLLQNGAARVEGELQQVKEWFAELEHYGFIVLAVHGSLGVDGKGKARTGD